MLDRNRPSALPMIGALCHHELVIVTDSAVLPLLSLILRDVHGESHERSQSLTSAGLSGRVLMIERQMEDPLQTPGRFPCQGALLR